MAASVKSILLSEVLYILFIYFACVCCSRLNVPRVLLPFSTVTPVNFTLEVSEGGCYKWSTSRPDIIELQPQNVDIHRDCSTTAVVIQIAKEPGRYTSLVQAVDIASGEILKCDILVGVIATLKLELTTHELYLDDAPEAFKIEAIDLQGSTFTTLDGFVFDWSLHPDADGKDTKAVRFIPFSRSTYKAPGSIWTLEREGKRGYIVLLEGKQTGSAKIRTTMTEPMYKNITTEEVLTVMANIILNPAHDVYLLVGTSLQYRVEVIKQGKPYRIEMPSEQYVLEVEDSSTARLDRATSTITSMKLGSTKINLNDRRMSAKQTFRQLAAGIHVVAPHHLGFKVLPHENWVLETNRVYEIQIEVYERKHRIHVVDNVKVKAVLPSQFFEVLSSSENGTWHLVLTKNEGACKIQAQLTSVLSEDGYMIPVSPTLEGSQEVEINSPIVIYPPEVILPWDPYSKGSHVIQLMATGGGTGGVQWSSSDGQVAAVTQRGEVTTFSDGGVSITASSLRNKYNHDSATVSILPVFDIRLLPGPVEAPIDESVLLNLAFYTFRDVEKKEGKSPFTNCSNLGLKLNIVDAKIFEQDSEKTYPAMGGGCTIIPLKAKTVGATRVFVSYMHGDTAIKTNTVIAAYKPLRPLTTEETIVLAVGSSQQIAFEGGPRPWKLKPDTYYRETSSSQEKLFTITPVGSGEGTRRNEDLHVFEVLCRDIGESDLTLIVGNHKSPTNSMPAKSKASIRVSCALPTSLELRPQLQLHVGRRGTCGTESGTKFAVPCYQDLDIVAKVRDGSDRLFTNFSSLVVKWKLSDPSLAQLSQTDGLLNDETDSPGYRVLTRSYQTLRPQSKEGWVRVTAEIVGSPDEVTNANKLMTYQHLFKIQSFVDIELFGNSVISPSRISVFNHPSSKGTLNIRKGSGYFEIEPLKNNLARISYDEKTRQIQVFPIADGSFIVTVYDLCLDTKEHATAEISVTGIKSIDVRVVDKVEHGKEIQATVRVLDGDGHHLPHLVFPLINLTPHPGSSIISVRYHDTDFDKAMYYVHGATVGQTALVFRAGGVTSGGQDMPTITSSPQPIQVFPPFKLQPRNLTLIVGAIFQLSSLGGPQPQANIGYSIASGDIANVTSGGIVEARALGKTTVIGQITGVDRDTATTVVFAQDEVTIFVVRLNDVTIHAPVTWLEEGAEMPVYAWGMNEFQSPFSFASAVPSLRFDWSVNNKEVASVQSLYQASGVNLDSTNNFRMRMIGKRHGHVTLSLRVRSFNSAPTILKDEVQIQVFEKLRLVNPGYHGDGAVIMTPNTEFLFVTNRDGVAVMRYTLLSSSDRCVALDKRGVITSFDSHCDAAVKVTALEEFGVNQTFVVPVIVKAVSYLMVTSTSAIRAHGDQLAVIPLGVTINFRVSFHDNSGRKFQATNSNIKYSSNRIDLVELASGQNNSTLIARATKSGRTIVRIWDDNSPHMEDYFSIVAGEVISPSNVEMTVGEVICFTSPILSPEGQPGWWKADPSSNLHVSRSGAGIALSPGTSAVYYNTSFTTVSSTEVKVTPLVRVEFLPHHVKYVSNSVPGREFHIPILLHGEPLSNRSNNLLGGGNCSNTLLDDNTLLRGRIPFTCEVTFTNKELDVTAKDVFHVKPGFDVTSGQYECIVSPVEPYLHPADLTTVVTDSEVQVVVNQGLGTTTRIPFLPAFTVLVADIHVSNQQPLATIVIMATTQLVQFIQVTARNPALLQVHAIEKDSKSLNTWRVDVELRDPCGAADASPPPAVDVLCTATKQLVSLPVRARIIGDYSQCPSLGRKAGFPSMFVDAAESYFIRWFSIAVIVLALLVGYWMLFGRTYYKSSPNPPGFLNTSGIGSPTTARVSPFSPEVRKPYLWTESNQPVHGATPRTSPPKSGIPSYSFS